ncbi:MAG: AMP-binding protein [Desulforhopalus sp.]|nr:AMP-binding protein [Desulforhopalus sp.]
MGLYDFTFYDLIKRNAVAFGSRVCWQEVDDGRQLTFAEYKIRVDLLAGGLSRAGVVKGDRIGVLGKNSLEFFLVYGAAARLGAIVLPVNWRLSADEVCYNLNDCQSKIVFADAEFQHILEGNREQLPSVEACYNLKGDLGDALKFTSLLEVGTQINSGEVASTDGFVIIHTAAVAGRPRGALLSHNNILCADMHFIHCMEFTPKDVNLNLLPLFHVAGLFMATSTFHAGGLSLNISKFEAKETARLIEDKGATLFFDFPPILDSILKAAAEDNRDISSLRAIVGLGTPEVIEQFQTVSGGSYYAMYGQTETSCLATIGKYDDRPGSAGKVIMLGDVQLVDEHDTVVAFGEVGEISVKGPMVFMGYWGLPEDNAYAFREGWHHTGDLGRFDEDGFLFYAGRKAEKELIKPGGENVYPAEVEKVILQHSAVEKTVVIGVPDPKWKEGIKAVCQLQEGKTLTAAELIAFVGERIARFKKPQYVEFVSELPMKEDGSLDRVAVKSLYGEA